MVVVLYKWWCWCISSLWWSCITGGDGVFICHGDVLVMMRWLWWCIGGGGVCGVVSVEVVLLCAVLLGMGYCMWWCVSGGGGGDGSLILLLMWILKMSVLPPTDLHPHVCPGARHGRLRHRNRRQRSGRQTCPNLLM